MIDNGKTKERRRTENLQGNVGEVQGRGSVRQGNDNRTGEGRIGQDAVEGRSEGNGKDISLLKKKGKRLMSSNKSTAIGLIVVIFISLLASGLLSGVLAIPRMWLTNPKVKIMDTGIGFYRVQMSGLDEGDTIELKNAPSKNVVHLKGRLSNDSFGYLTAFVVNNNKIKVFCNNTEAYDYSSSTDLQMSSVFESKNFLFSYCHANIKLHRGENKIVVISGNAKKTFYLHIN